MSLPIPPPYFTTPKLVDKVVQTLRTDFTNNLIAWLQYCYPVAKIGIREDGETYPQIYANDGSNTHYDIVPDQADQSYCFFEDNGADLYMDDEEGYMKYSLSVVFWGRLDKIDVGSAYDYTQELIAAMTGRLLHNDARNIRIDTNYKDVFKNYSLLKLEKENFLMKQMTGFRISFDIIGDVCTQNFTPVGGTGCAGQQLTPCEILFNSLTDTQINCLLGYITWTSANNSLQ